MSLMMLMMMLKLFKEIFGFTPVKLTDILINITKKEDNKMIIDHIKIKKKKFF